MYDTFAIADVVSTVSMSSTAPPEDINPNISTLYITYQGPPGEWRVIQDYRENSVLHGFSAAGGLGSFLSLLCAILFGTSLFSVLFRKSFLCSAIGYSVCINALTENYKGRSLSVRLASSMALRASEMS